MYDSNNLTLTSTALAQNDYMDGYNHRMGYGGGWGFGIVSWIGILLFWSLIIAAIVLVVKSIAGSSKKNPNQKIETPMDILEKRYAKGEISKEEFEKIKNDLGGK